MNKLPLSDRRASNDSPFRVLLIDGTPANIRATTELLQPEFEVSFATRGDKGLALARAQPAPDLILLDLMMPGMDSYGICRELKNDDLTRDIPVIFVTNSESERAEEHGLQLGAVDYITRPISGPILRARARTHVTLRRRNLAFEKLALVDGLTGLANRRRLEEVLAVEWSRSIREASLLGVIFADVDHFKRYNDSYGHGSGDEALREVAACMEQCIRRPGDLIARYGGEEFVVLMPSTRLSGVIAVAEQLRERIECLNLKPAPVTVSIGCHSMVASTVFRPGHLLSLADEQLYRAKHEGRNRVCWDGPRELLGLGRQGPGVAEQGGVAEPESSPLDAAAAA